MKIKFYPRIPFILDPGKKIPKKIEKKLKYLFLALFLAKTGWDRPRKREKNSTPEFCSYPTRAWKFQIKNRKKIQKIKKVYSDIVSIQNGLGDAKNEKKKIYSRISFIPDTCKEILKKKAKKYKKIKKPFPALFLAKTG